MATGSTGTEPRGDTSMEHNQMQAENRELRDSLRRSQEHADWLERELESVRREMNALKFVAQTRYHQIKELGGRPEL